MFLTKFSQSDLDHRVAMFIANGQLPQAQAILGPAGYTIEVLQEGQALLNAWRASRAETRITLKAQKEVTQIGRQARAAVQQCYGHFSRAVHTLFEEDEAILRLLGLRPHTWSTGYHRNGHSPVEADAAETNGHRHGSSPTGLASSKVSTVIDCCRTCFANAQRLDEESLAVLAQRGWSRARIAESAELVEALARSIIKQHEAAQAHRNQSRATQALEGQLRHWYRDSRQLSRSALQQAGLEGSEVQVMLGL